MAEQEGDTEKTKSLGEKLQELEERADQLDKQRTKGLSAIRYCICRAMYELMCMCTLKVSFSLSCSYINERNRQRNVVRAELALKVIESVLCLRS